MKEQMAGLAQHRTDQEKEIDKLKEKNISLRKTIMVLEQ